MSARANEPAHPVIVDSEPNCGPTGDLTRYTTRGGLTIREEFAAMAMQGILASWPANQRALDPLATSETAVQHADALLAALSKGGGK